LALFGIDLVAYFAYFYNSGGSSNKRKELGEGPKLQLKATIHKNLTFIFHATQQLIPLNTQPERYPLYLFLPMLCKTQIYLL
jgi:hypothetical protein